MTFGGSLRHGFRNLFRWSGRDTRAAFWPFAGVAFAATQVLGMALAIPFFVGTFARMRRFAVEHPDQVTVRQGPGSYSMQIHEAHPELMPDMTGFTGVVAFTAGLFAVLVAAALVRRLHDTGRAGWWGLMPLPFLAVSFSTFDRVADRFSTGSPDMGLFALMFASNLIYLVALVALIVLLARAGQRGDNRFGPQSS